MPYRARDELLQGIVFVRSPTGGRSSGDTIREAPGLAAKEGDKVTIGIRPEHLSVPQDGREALFRSQVALVERLGGETLIYVKPPAGSDLLAVKVAGKVQLKLGEPIALTAAAEHMYFFAADGRRIL